jgi:hypothetical protein
MHDHTGLRVNFRERDLPAIGGRLHQHAPGGRDLQPDFVPIAAHRAAAIRNHQAAEHRIAEDRRDDRRIGCRHLGPVGVQLFGADHGQASERALAHLGNGDGEDDAAVWADGDPGADRLRAVAGGHRRFGQQGAWNAQRESEACCAVQEVAA